MSNEAANIKKKLRLKNSCPKSVEGLLADRIVSRIGWKKSPKDEGSKFCLIASSIVVFELFWSGYLIAVKFPKRFPP